MESISVEDHVQSDLVPTYRDSTSNIWISFSQPVTNWLFTDRDGDLVKPRPGELIGDADANPPAHVRALTMHHEPSSSLELCGRQLWRGATLTNREYDIFICSF